MATDVERGGGIVEDFPAREDADAEPDIGTERVEALLLVEGGPVVRRVGEGGGRGGGALEVEGERGVARGGPPRP